MNIYQLLWLSLLALIPQGCVAVEILAIRVLFTVKLTQVAWRYLFSQYHYFLVISYLNMYSWLSHISLVLNSPWSHDTPSALLYRIHPGRSSWQDRSCKVCYLSVEYKSVMKMTPTCKHSLHTGHTRTPWKKGCPWWRTGQSYKHSQHPGYSDNTHSPHSFWWRNRSKYSLLVLVQSV